MANFSGLITLLSNELDSQRLGVVSHTAKEREQLGLIAELVASLELLGHVTSGRPLTLVREKSARVAAKAKA